MNKQSKLNWSKDKFFKPFCWFIICVRKMQVTTFYESKGPAWKKLYFFNKPQVLVMKVRYIFMNMVIFLGTHIFLLTWKWTCSQIIRSWLKIEDVFSATNGNAFGLYKEYQPVIFPTTYTYHYTILIYIQIFPDFLKE